MILHGIQIFNGGCVSKFFESYEAWGGLFATIGFLFAHLIQVVTCCIRKPIYHENQEISYSQRDAIQMASLISLEAGIAFHSLLIGVTLGTTVRGFIPLLIAISFHQFFEGLALSSVISEMKFEKSNSKYLMLTIYIFSTPFGTAFGILVRKICIFIITK
jgi:zinc transporter 1/2/3